MNMTKAFFSFAGVCASVVFSCSLAAADYSTWIWQTQNDTNAAPSKVTGCSFWGSSFWSDGKNPDPGKSYYVPSGIHHFSPNKGNGPFIFDGDMLAVSGVFHLKTGYGKVFNYKNLILDDGALFAYEYPGFATGKVTVVSSRQNPAIMRVNYTYEGNSKVTFKILADMVSEPDACVRMENQLTKQCYQRFTGDNSGFFGTFVLADPYAIYTADDFLEFPGTLAYATNSTLTVPVGFPGAVASTEGYALDITSNNAENFEAFEGGVLSYTQSRSVKDLTLGADSLLKVPFSGKTATALTVTNSFAVADGAMIELDGFSSVAFTNGIENVSVLRLEGVAAENAPDVSALRFKTLECGLPRSAVFAWVDGEDGSKTLSLSWKPVVIAKQFVTATQMLDENYAGYWSDGKLPHEGCDYLMIGNGATDTFSCPSTFSFPGDSLTLEKQSVYMNKAGADWRGADCHFDDLRLNGFAATFYESNKKFTGVMQIMPGGASFSIYQTKFLNLYCEIKGEGNLKFDGKSSNASPYGTAVLAGTNLCYGGRITVTTPVFAGNGNKPATPNPDSDPQIVTRCLVHDGRALGGRYTKDDNAYSAITIQNYSKLYTERSISIDEPTRGVFIDNGALFEVPDGESLTINSAITYNGELRKLGGGTLALGARALFVDGNAETAPVEGKNILSVRAGALKPVNPQSTDGLAMEFKEGTSLVLPANGAVGFLSVRNGSSITVDTLSGKVPVHFDLTGFDVSGTAFSIPLATVKEEMAQTVAAKLAPKSKVGKNALQKIDVVSNGDGTATIKAKYVFKALSITIR